MQRLLGLAICLAAAPLLAADYAGSYQAEVEGLGPVTLQLSAADDGYTGTMTVQGQPYQVVGQVDQEGDLRGRLVLKEAVQPKVGEDYLEWAATFDGDKLYVAVEFPKGLAELNMTRTGEAPAGQPADPAGPATQPATSPGTQPAAGQRRWAGRYEADDLVLELGEVGDGRVFGRIRIGAEEHRVGGRVDPEAGILSGVVELQPVADGQPQEYLHFVYFAAAMKPDGLHLEVRLKDGVQQAALPRVGDGSMPSGQVRTPEALKDVYDGPVQQHSHPEGYFTLEAPQAWTPAGRDEDLILINPGLKQGDKVDAVIALGWGELPEEDRNLPVDRLLEKRGPELQAMLAQGLGVQFSEPGPTRLVATRDVPGAVAEWPGQKGDQKYTLWIGAVVKREYYMAVLAVVEEGAQAKYLPGCRRILLTLAPRPPERNLAAEQALVGRSFGHTSSESGGSFSSWYEFRAGNQVTKTSTISGLGLGGVDGGTDEAGQYQVIGQTVFIFLKSGQVTGQLVIEGGGIAAIQIGSSRYGPA